MTIRFDVPEDIEHQLRSTGIDSPRLAKELFFVDLYRKNLISHHDLAVALGLTRYETDGVLKRHDVPIDLSLDDLEAEAALEKLGRP